MLNYSANGPSGYNLTNSLRFRASASAYLNRTFGSGNTQIMTYSAWVKRGNLASDSFLIYENPVGGNGADHAFFYFKSDNTLRLGGGSGGVSQFDITTTQVFRDPSAWYHIVIAIDTTQATSSNRIKLYVNGLQVTSFSSASYPSQNANLKLNSANPHFIGAYTIPTQAYYDGYMTEINWIDGQALTPSSFGNYNSATGVWQPAKYTGTYGTNGYYLPFNSTIASGFSSYYGNFNGSSQSLTLPASSALQLGTNQYTIECWVNASSFSTSPVIYDGRTSGTGTAIQIYVPSTGIINIYGGTNVGTLLITASQALATNTWYHIALVRGASNVTTLYINGVSVGSTTDTTNYNAAQSGATIAKNGVAATAYFNGYISNFRIVNGSAVYTAPFNPPTSALTAITNTSLLTLQNSTIIDNSTNAFSITNNGSVTTTSATVGTYVNVAKDSSGNTNNWLANNINVTTSGTTYDSMTDVPTLTSTTTANYATLNPLKSNSTTTTFSEANLKATFPSVSAGGTTLATFAVSSGKWYWEITVGGTDGATQPKIGILSPTYLTETTASVDVATGGYAYSRNGTKWIVGVNTAYGTAFTTNDVIGFALDMDAGTLVCYLNNVSQGTLATGLSGLLSPAMTGYTGITLFANFGQRPFTYTAPSGYLPLNTYNLPTSTIVQGNKYMDATTYTGTAANGNVITNAAGFQPDFVWAKGRSMTSNHDLVDSSRGTTKYVYSSLAEAEGTWTDKLVSFNSNGFTLNSDQTGTGQMNSTNGGSYVAWQWKANAGSTSSNTSGSITSIVQVNTTAGFSIVTYTGTGANATVGHGLGVAPKMIFIKNRSSGTLNWGVYNATVGNTKVLLLNTNAAASAADPSFWNNTSPTSTTFSLSTWPEANNSGNNFVAYCWAEIAGFSSFGSAVGNGSADGVFVYTGFQPKFILWKKSSGTGDWRIWDSSRSTYNAAQRILYANAFDAEYDPNNGTSNVDILSNGFKLRSSNLNENGATYIYACFASNPFKNSLAR